MFSKPVNLPFSSGAAERPEAKLPSKKTYAQIARKHIPFPDIPSNTQELLCRACSLSRGKQDDEDLIEEVSPRDPRIESYRDVLERLSKLSPSDFVVITHW